MSYSLEYLPESTINNIRKIINEDNKTFVVSGASLSYNRYDFDPEPRRNAYECYPGMLSWSFVLRDAIKQNDKWYKFGDEINFNGCSSFKGISLMPPLTEEKKYLCMNHGKVTGLIIENPEQNVKFYYAHNNLASKKAILHMQKRDNLFSCSFDVYVDDKLVLEKLSNKGNPEIYQGYEPFEIELPIKGNNCIHEISIRNVKSQNNENVIINVTGIGTKKTNVNLTGCGNQTTKFFIDNIDERILKYNPDVLFFTTGANDRARLTEEEFSDNLRQIIQSVKNKLPGCEIVIIGPPYSEKYTDEYGQKYIRVIYNVCTEFKCVFINHEILFKGMPIEKWRFDNVHMTKYGNTIQAVKIIDLLFPYDSYHRKELVNAEVWV